MLSITRWDSFRNLSTLQEQMKRLFEDGFRGRTDDSTLTAWRRPWTSTKPRTSWS